MKHYLNDLNFLFKFLGCETLFGGSWKKMNEDQDKRSKFITEVWHTIF